MATSADTDDNVNGTLEGSTAYSSSRTATGATQVGRARFNGSASNYWPGLLDDVRLNPGVLA